MDRERQTLEWIRKYKNGEEDMRNEIVQLNIPFIHYCTRKYKPSQLEYDDALSVALMAFSIAINDFDESKGFKFTTFSGRVIQHMLYQEYRKLKKREKDISIEIPICEETNHGVITIADTLRAPEKEHVFLARG